MQEKEPIDWLLLEESCRVLPCRVPSRGLFVVVVVWCACFGLRCFDWIGLDWI